MKSRLPKAVRLASVIVASVSLHLFFTSLRGCSADAGLFLQASGTTLYSCIMSLRLGKIHRVIDGEDGGG
jgi:hypothetical protein